MEKLDKLVDTKNTEETIQCEKCGGETKQATIGDETYTQCIDCGWITP